MENKILFDPNVFKKGILYKNPEFYNTNGNQKLPEKIERKEPIINIPKIGTNKNWVNFNANKGFTSLKKDETINIGNNKIYITDPYGIRKWKNNEHSTGIDFKTDNGKVIALKDGEIISVSLQGSGKTETSAGYYMKVKHDDGSYGEYMHLDPISEEDKKSLLGKKIKRGDNIWGYTKGSGSMTGKHVKFRLYGQDPKVNIDPSQAFRGQSYDFIPDSYGKNIF